MDYVAFESESMLRLETMGKVREANTLRLEEALLSGRSAILAGSSGLGKSYVASNVGMRLTADGTPVKRVRCTRWNDRQLEVLIDHRESAIIVDDAHLLDTDDLAELVELMCTSTATVLATIDPDEINSRQGDDDRRRLITSLWTDLGIERVDLSGVGYAESVAIVEGVTGRAGIDTVSRTRIIVQAAGNPLFVRELALEYRDNPPESLGPEQNGAWGAVTLSTRLLDLIHTRMHDLTDDDAYALTMLARLGTTPYARAVRLVGQGPVRTLLRLGLASRSSRSSDGVSVNLLYAHALLSGHRSDNPLDSSNRVELFLLDEHRSGLPLTSAECALVAHYLTVRPQSDTLAPSTRETARLFARAAQHAREFGQISSAALFAHHSLQLVPNALALEQASRCLVADGRVVDAFELVRNQDITDRERDEDMGLLLWGMALVTLQKPDADDLGDLVRLARSWETVSSELDSLLSVFEARASLVASGYRDGVDALEKIAADKSVSTEVMLRCLSELMEAYTYQGRMSEFSRVLHHGWALVTERVRRVRGSDGRDRYGAATDFVARAGMLRIVTGFDRNGLRRELDAYAFRGLEGADQRGLALVNLIAGQLAIEQGDPQLAEIELRRCLERQPKGAHPYWHTWAKELHTNAQANMHRRTDTHATGHEASKAELAARHSILLDFYSVQTAVRRLLDAGEGPMALAATQRYARSAESVSYLLAVRGYHGAVALGLPVEKALGALARLPRGEECELVRLIETYLVAESTHDAHTLDRLADKMIRRGLRWEAYIALQSAAVTHRRKGQLDAAAASECRAARLEIVDDDDSDIGASDDRFSVAPALDAETAAKIARLTKRELEVAQLTGAGLSNSEIAKRLFISVRTVESHVWQARAKLGMSRRGDLGRLVAALPLDQDAMTNAGRPEVR